MIKRSKVTTCEADVSNACANEVLNSSSSSAITVKNNRLYKTIPTAVATITAKTAAKAYSETLIRKYEHRLIWHILDLS